MRTHHCLGCSGSKRFAAPSLRSGASMRKQLCGKPAGATSRHVSFPHKAQGRGFELGPTEVLGTQEGLRSQWCNRLPSIHQEDGGERGCGRYVLSASYLTHPPLKPSTYLRTRGRVDNLSCPLQTLNREGQQEADDLQFKAPGRHGMHLPGKHRAQLAEDRLDILANRLAQKFHPSWHLSLGSLPALGFQM